MPLIVVMDDDASTRVLVSAVLRKEGYDVLVAENGALGLALIQEHKPDLVVSDVQMPLLDGFGVLKALQDDDTITSIPVILLTSLQDREYIRHGMTRGAHDYLTKPFEPQELLDAVNAQLSKLLRSEMIQAKETDRVIAQALARQREKISALYEKRASKEAPSQWSSRHSKQQAEQHFAYATVLYADIRDYAVWTQYLSPAQMGQVVRQFYATVGDTLQLFGVHYMQFIGEGMLCVFVEDSDTNSVNHAMRAVKAAFGLQDGVRRMDAFVEKTFERQDLPSFGLTVALHSGEISFAKLDDVFNGESQLTPLGDAVTAVLHLFESQPALDWSVAASAQTHALAEQVCREGRHAKLQASSKTQPSTLHVIELLAL